MASSHADNHRALRWSSHRFGRGIPILDRNTTSVRADLDESINVEPSRRPSEVMEGRVSGEPEGALRPEIAAAVQECAAAGHKLSVRLERGAEAGRSGFYKFLDG